MHCTQFQDFLARVAIYIILRKNIHILVQFPNIITRDFLIQNYYNLFKIECAAVLRNNDNYDGYCYNVPEVTKKCISLTRH